MPLPRGKDLPSHVDRDRDRETGKSVFAPAARKKQESHVPVLLLIVALASLATMLCYKAFLGKYDRGLHNSVAQHLHRFFPDSIVQLGRVTSDGPGRIVVSDLRIASRHSQDKRPIIRIHRSVLHGDLDVANWARETIRVTEIHLYGVRIDAWPDAMGIWSIQLLNPQPDPEAVAPKIAFHDATVRLFSDATTRAHVTSIHDINGRIVPVDRSSIPSNIDERRGGGKRSMQVHLTCSGGDLFNKVELDGEVDADTKSWTASGRMENFHFSSKMLEALPPQLSQYFSQLSGLECQTSTNYFKISSANLQPVSFEVQGTIAAGRLRDPRLPYPLEALHGNFFCTNEILQLRSMRASSGGASFELSCDILGFERDARMEIHAKATHLEIDGRLRQSLPETLQEQWDRLQPAGVVSGSVQLTFDGAQWTPVASIQCEDVSLKPWLFPYPLSKIQGLIRYQQGTISSDRLEGRAGGQLLSGSLSLSRSGSQWYGKISGKSDGKFAIDEQLIAALTPQDKGISSAERFVRSLHPTGSVELTRASFERKSDADPVWHRTIDVNVYDGSINYDRFRYPIYDIRGRIAGQDDSWWLHRFEGHNDSGRIQCSGNWRSNDEGNIPFDLRFEAFAVPIEEELQTALTPDVQSIWDELQPSGSIDRVDVRLSRRPNEPVVTRVTIEEESASNQTTGRSLRIQPRSFPIWLTDIDCSIAYEPGGVLIHSASGVNGDSRLSIQGDCRPQPDGRWLADVDWQPRTRLIVDSQLLRVLPKSMRDSLVKIDFRGPVSILGNSQILFANRSEMKLQTAWDCQLDVENGQLGDGNGIGALRGTVWAKGSSDGTNLNASGTIAMDALTVQGLPVTRLRGPYALQDNTLFFGSRVHEELGPPQSAEQPSEMTADALTGNLTLTGVGLLDSGKFIVNASLRKAELSTLLRDLGVDRASTRALCDARVDFSGIPWNSQTWKGDGDISLTNAQLFQLPFMMRLLRTASVNADDDSAFQTADIHFDIDGDLIPLQIKCDGDVLRLRGEGWTNLRKEIDLELYSYVGRRPIYSVVSPLLTESRYATFMMIEVDGTLDNPVMQRRPFPQIESTLQQIFPEVAERNRMDSLIPWR